MQIYELDLLISSRLDEKEAAEHLEKIRRDIEKTSAKILSSGALSKTALAYPIKKEMYAYFNGLVLEILPEEFAKLKEVLKHEEKILRYFIVKHKTIVQKTKRDVSEKKEVKKEETKINEAQEVTIMSEAIEKETAPKTIEKKPTVKKVAVKKEIKKKEAPKKEKPKKEPKIKLEDIDKSLEKILEKEL